MSEKERHGWEIITIPLPCLLSVIGDHKPGIIAEPENAHHHSIVQVDNGIQQETPAKCIQKGGASVSPNSCYTDTISAPNGVSASFAILKNCFPKGIPTMVMHQSKPITRFPNAMGIPKKMSQMMLAKVEKTPPP